MTRIAVLSDSHVNSIKGGWDLVANEYPQCELTFFAAARRNLWCLEVSSGRLIASDPRTAQRMRRSFNGLDGIDGSFDWYLLYGLGFGFKPTFLLYMTHRTECDEIDERIPISNACFQYAVEDELNESISVATVTKLREITNAPIVVAAYPQRSRVESFPLLGRVRETGVDRKIKAMADDVALSAFPNGMTSSSCFNPSTHSRAL